MLGENQLRKKMLSGEQVFGVFSSIPSPTAVELIGESGFDFVIIDTEHVLTNPETLENMIRAAEAVHLTPLVRVEDTHPKRILKILDAGAQGIVLPMIEHAEEVRQVIQACKYHPLGKRSLNAGRPGAFGKNKAFGSNGLVDYMAFANQQIMIIPMIESITGVKNAKEIAAVDGVSFVLEGAADLSQSMGHPWEINHPEVQHALKEVLDVCKETGTPYCAIPRQDNQLQQWFDLGVKIFVLGDERGIAFRALCSRLEQAKLEIK